jgi:CHAD domain-containing protein
VGEVVRGALAASVGRLITHDPGVRLGDDPEDVHQARVATRRLRSDLRTFRDVLDREWAQSLRHDLRGLATRLGEVRDTEVLLDRLRSRVDRLPAVDQDVAKPVLRRLLQRWDAGRHELLDELRSPRYAELLDRLVEAARAPAIAAQVADERAADVLPPLVRAAWERLRTAVDELAADPPDEALHDIRKLAKHCRYSAEAVAPAVGKQARSFARAMADLQDVLGAHQDAVVAETWLRDVASKASGREVFVAGQLASLEHLDIERTRAAWRDVWRTARKKRLRRWL